MTLRLGVICGPGKKSLSPVFQQAALERLRLDITYDAWPTPTDELEARVHALREPQVLGANVTIPHKEAVLPFVDETGALVRKVGATNTIVNREGRLHAFNTDVGGFLRALRDDGNFEPAGRRAVIAGAGGAARAVVMALIQAGASSVAVVNRTPSRGVRLVDDMRSLAGETRLEALPDTLPAWTGAVRESDLLVNCTSVGSVVAGGERKSPVPLGVIHPGLFVFDLVYYPSETLLMAHARKRGAGVLGGLPMLIAQGAESFRLWTGLEPPVDVMLDAAERALEGEGPPAGLEPREGDERA
jgi:shikimate dehydrogenase